MYAPRLPPLLFALLLTACGHSPSGPASEAPPPRPAPTAGAVPDAGAVAKPLPDAGSLPDAGGLPDAGRDGGEAALPDATRPASCATARAPIVREVGRTPRALAELSGLTASRRHPGLFWAHNDSGHTPTLYALDAQGRVRAAFTVFVSAQDVEDVAVGPCEEGSCVWLADIGDNGARRAEVQLLRAAEPEGLESRPLKVEVQRFVYEDGPQDAESLVAEPGSGRLFVLTKALGSLGRLYVLEGLSPTGVGRARYVATLPARSFVQRAATAASLSPDGTRLLVRGYFGAWEWARPGAKRLEDVVRATPRELPAPSQPQAEAAAWLPDGSGYLLGSEGEGTPLYRVDCAVPAP